MNLRRVLALIGVILLVGLYLSTLILALIGNPAFSRLFLAAVLSTIAVPVILHLFLMLNNARKGKSVMDETYSYREKEENKEA